MGTENLIIDDGSEPDDEANEMEENMKDVEDMKVEKHVEGIYACPEFIFSKHEEKRIYKPCHKGVIVKLFWRQIGYKALETRLKQIWARKGMINIIDLSNNYYLVIFLN